LSIGNIIRKIKCWLGLHAYEWDGPNFDDTGYCRFCDNYFCHEYDFHAPWIRKLSKERDGI